MGLEKFRHEKVDDAYVNVDVIDSNLRHAKRNTPWYHNVTLITDGPFSHINTETTFLNTNRRISIFDED